MGFDQRDYVQQFTRVVEVAEKVGGKNHGMRFIEATLNMMDPYALTHNY